MATYRGNLYYYDPEYGERRILACFDVAAKDRTEAERKVLDQHWDERLYMSGCSPIMEMQKTPTHHTPDTKWQQKLNVLSVVIGKEVTTVMKEIMNMEPTDSEFIETKKKIIELWEMHGRDKMIDAIVNHHAEWVDGLDLDGLKSVIADFVLHGIKGYVEMSDSELIDDITAQTASDIEEFMEFFE